MSTIRKGRVTVRKQTYYSHALAALQTSLPGKVRVLVDEMDLSSVLVEHPLNEGRLIQADSTNPEYTTGLSMWEHEQVLKDRAAKTTEDLQAVGPYAWLLARYKLMSRIQGDSEVARSMVAKITRGRPREMPAKPIPPDDGNFTEFLDEDLTIVQASPQQEARGHAPGTDQSVGAAATTDAQTAHELSEWSLPDILFTEVRHEAHKYRAKDVLQHRPRGGGRNQRTN